MLRNLAGQFRLVLVDNWEGDAATFPPGSFGVADMAVVVPGDRHDVVMAASLAELSGTRLAALLLSAGTEPDPRVWDLTQATRATGPPILVVDDSSYETATRMRDLGPGLPIDDLDGSRP